MKKLLVNNWPRVDAPTIGWSVLAGLSFLLILGQFQRWQVNLNVGVYGHDLLLVGFLAWSLWSVPAYWRQVTHFLWKLGWGEKLFILWIGLGWGIHAALHSFSLTPLLYSVRLLVYLLSMGLFWQLLKHSHELKERIRCSTLGVGMGWTWFGLLQYFLMPDTRWLRFLGWDDHYYRLISTIFDPGFTGILLVLVLWYAASKIWQHRIGIPSHLQQFTRVLNLGIIISILVALLLTYSRASYLAFLVSLAALGGYFIWQKSLQKVALTGLVGAVFVGMIFLLPRPGGEGVKLERTSSAAARLTILKEGMTSLRGYEWITGQGLFLSQVSPQRTPDFADHANVTDSWLMFFLQGSGVVGLVLFLILAVKYFLAAWKLSPLLGVSIVALAVHGLFNASLMYPLVVLYLGMITFSHYSMKHD